MPRTLRLAVVLVSLLSATFVLKASLPQVSTGTWQAAGNLGTARAGAAAVTLPDGRILITGGSDASGVPSATAEFFNTNGTFTAAASMNAARTGHAAIVLPDGRVLVTGGHTTGGGISNSAEAYDPQTNLWQTLPATMVEARAGHTMSQLLNGDVLLAGGESSSGPVSALEIFDETNDTFTSAGALASARQDHAAAVLGDGRVLIAGGTGVDASGNPAALSSTEIYDPSIGSVSAGPAMSTGRARLSATSLLHGTVALIGGNDGSNDLASIEIYDSAAGTISLSPATLATARSGHLAFLLPHNSSVLIVGGSSGATELASAELFAPWNTAVQATGVMASPRAGAAGAPLSSADGLLLVAGGQNASAGTLSSGELYGFATVKTDQSDYAPGTTVNITGSGWQPGETVTLTLVESPNIDTHPAMTAVADQNGNISNSQFSPDSHDLNVRFYLTAVGSQSQAQTTFTDAIGTNTTISSSQNPSSAGQSVTFTATVTETSQGGGNPGTPVTAGTVDFRIGGNNCNQGQGTVFASGLSLNGSGQASASNTFASTGTFSIRACYNGTSGISASNGSLTQTVNGVTVSATNSTVSANPASVTADGSSTSTITVTLKDTNNNPVSGKTVSLTAGSGSSTYTTVSGTTNSNGMATFSVKDSVAESVTYTGKDTTDNITVTQTAAVTFTVGNVNAGTSTVVANPTSVTADGTSTSTVTVTLKDASNNPVSGKTVTLSQGSGSSIISAASGPSNSSGVVTFTLKDTKAETVTYSAADTTDSIAITQTAAVTFTPGSATKFLVSAPATANLGTAFSFTVTAQDANNNTATGYTGAVHFTSSDAQAMLPANSTLSNGTGNFSATLKSAGNQTITGTDTVTASITGTSAAINVSKGDTTTAIVSSVNPSVYGQSVTFTATVSAVAPATGTATGTVTFKDGTTTLGTGTLSGGQANFSSSSVSVASHSITAEYAGDGNFNTSTSSALSQTVKMADTSTTVSSSANPSVFGQSVTFTATVSAVAPGAGTATGTVTFKDGSNTLGTGALNGSGQATFSTSSLSVPGSPHVITAVYGSDGNFNASTSSALNQTVNMADTSTTVSSSANPSVFGQSVTFTATVSAVAPGAGTATGTVTFKDGANTLGTGTLSGGQATFSTSSLNVASHLITAEYGGDGNFNSSPSSALSQTVDKAKTTTSLVSSANPSVFGQSVTFTATVSPVAPGAGSPSGTIQFQIDGVNFGSPVALSGGSATTATSSLSVGNHTVTADYSGDNNFKMSTGTLSGGQTVNRADTSTTVASSLNPSVFGQSVTFTATVSVLAPGAGSPSGTIQFKIDGVDFGSPVVLSGGSATTATSSLSVGNHTVTADYSGDNNFKISTGTFSGGQTVNKADTSTTVTSALNPTVFGQSVTFTATVSVVPPGAGAPTGTVTFADAGTPIGSCTAVAISNPACSISSLNAGSHSITAIYNGDGNLNATGADAGSTATPLTQTVNKAGTSTAITSVSPEPSVTGQSYTVSWLVSVNSPGSGTPTGTVTVSDGSSSCYAAAGAGSCSLASMTAGPKTLTASYAGDTNFNGSSGTTPHSVNKASTTTTVSTIAPEPSVTGQSYSVSWTLMVTAPGSGTPTGTVTVSDGTGGSCSAAVSVGACSLISTSAGSKTITATYVGDTNYNGSIGTASHTVNRASTATTITSFAPEPSLASGSYTVNFSVAVVAPGAGMPTGNASVHDAYGNNCTGSLSGGSGSCLMNTSLGQVGSLAITASYSGDSNFLNSAGTANHTVQYEPAGTLCLGAPGHQILQPVNADGTSVFKQGSTVPAKFRVCDVNGTSIGTAGVVSSFRLVQVMSGTVASTVDESVDSTTPDSSFRWDPSSQQWIFNMYTKKLAANQTYVYAVTLNDGTTIPFQFGLR